ncbi:formyltetrahydrofolate deformylase [Micromonospora sp. KC606]|uniref:formyltetrahydrofolate deformylase n=1 Tax=Micromonospora sp. KC606 TaxID=2530379 RepID=UPI0010515514|nr:formyltetrahydrofolate deformylase [Micromonospora sp. KC606]TDC85787.1 formyltetrahydrofolate deformylase [Micromonospora sp. KC606]
MASRPSAGHEYVLTLTCPEGAGIVFAVSRFVMEHGGNINASHQFDDRLTDTFFMRVQFRLEGASADALRRDFASVASQFAMAWQLHDVHTPTRTLLMVSRFGHCLNDLVFRTRTGALNIEIPAIVSNHRDYEAVAEANDIPFFHVPVTPETKPAAEARLLELVDELDVDLVVLARYMQVLSNGLCGKLEGRAINIHHSFLPSFKGAKPYHQAHARGVKLVGATAHYVTPDLDEGPIIEQDVVRVDHSLDPAEMAAAGRDVEAQVLARAIRWHSEHRVLLDRNRTVVFR